MVANHYEISGRARAGYSRAELRALADRALALVRSLGGAPGPQKLRPSRGLCSGGSRSPGTCAAVHSNRVRGRVPSRRAPHSGPSGRRAGHPATREHARSTQTQPPGSRRAARCSDALLSRNGVALLLGGGRAQPPLHLAGGGGRDQ